MDGLLIVKKAVTTKFVETPSGDFEVYNLLEVLEELEGTACGFSHLVIYDRDLGIWLESVGACRKSARGSYYRGEKYQEVYDSLFKLVYEEE